jgi:hypothetical protein
VAEVNEEAKIRQAIDDAVKPSLMAKQPKAEYVALLTQQLKKILDAVPFDSDLTAVLQYIKTKLPNDDLVSADKIYNELLQHADMLAPIYTEHKANAAQRTADRAKSKAAFDLEADVEAADKAATVARERVGIITDPAYETLFNIMRVGDKTLNGAQLDAVRNYRQFYINSVPVENWPEVLKQDTKATAAASEAQYKRAENKAQYIVDTYGSSNADVPDYIIEDLKKNDWKLLMEIIKLMGGDV